jgi:UDP-4-amino-4-deoxy-L-arabinose-oxoglutarate aminotransferase
LDIKPGDEIITTPMTFVATANAIVHAGAKPVFVDVEPETGNIDVSKVEAAITDRTRVVMPVHLYGQMVDMVGLSEVAEARGIEIIEDAAHALEARRDPASLGSHSRAACLSFYATKNITSGEGGAIVTRDPEFADRLRKLRLHGMTAGAADRYTGTYRHYDVVEPGWKCNMSDVQAAILIGQLRRIDDLLDLRTEAFNRYRDVLGDYDALGIPERLSGSRHAAHLFTVQVRSEIRDAMLHALQQRGIGVAVNFRAVHLFETYREQFQYEEGQFPEAERIGASTISLPLFPSITKDEQDVVVNAVDDALKSLI